MMHSTTSAEFRSSDFDLRRTTYKSGAFQPLHWHNRPQISLVLQGSVEEAVTDCTQRGHSLSVVYKPLGILHSDRYGAEGATILQIELNSSELLSPQLNWHWSFALNTIRSFLHLAKKFDDANCTDAELMALAKDVVRSLFGVSMRHKDADGTSAPQWLQQARRAVLAGSRNSISVEQLALQFQIHPVYLTRQFRRYFGETIRSCLSRRRVRTAAFLIADTSRNFADIAYELGYADQAHFSREFRKLTGLSPREFRNLIR